MSAEGAARTASLGAIAGTAWLGLGIQLRLVLAASAASGVGPADAVLNFLGYFTILTNFLVAVSFSAQLLAPRFSAGRFFGHPAVQAGVTLAIALVGLGYNLLLRWTWAPEGWARFSDEIVHTVVPLAVVGFWFAFVPKGALGWRHLGWWALYPTAYLVMTLVRGAMTGVYPYWFLDVGALGALRALASAVVLLLGFLLMGVGLVAVDGALGRRARSAA